MARRVVRACYGRSLLVASFLLLLVSVVVAGASPEEGKRGDKECAELGFNKPSCRHCNVLARKLKQQHKETEERDETAGAEQPNIIQKLVDECKSCCEKKEGDIDDSEGEGGAHDDSAVSKFVSAVIEYDADYNFHKTPLQEFIKKFAKDFPNLRLVDNNRWVPRLTLKSKDGDFEHISLAQWRADMIKDFLDGKLEKKPSEVKKKQKKTVSSGKKMNKK